MVIVWGKTRIVCTRKLFDTDKIIYVGQQKQIDMTTHSALRGF